MQGDAWRASCPRRVERGIARARGLAWMLRRVVVIFVVAAIARRSRAERRPFAALFARA
jgi:hypothetical protein